LQECCCVDEVKVILFMPGLTAVAAKLASTSWACFFPALL
jgi:hypothetical protein